MEHAHILFPVLVCPAAWARRTLEWSCQMMQLSGLFLLPSLALQVLLHERQLLSAQVDSASVWFRLCIENFLHRIKSRSPLTRCYTDWQSSLRKIRLRIGFALLLRNSLLIRTFRSAPWKQPS